MNLASLAAQLQLEYVGDGEYPISGVTPLDKPRDHCVSFLNDNKYDRFLDIANCGVVILKADRAAACKTHHIISPNPYVSYAQAAQLLYPALSASGIHPTAVIEKGAELDASAYVGAYAVVSSGAKVGAGTQIGAGCFIGTDVKIGDNCLLHANVSIYSNCVIGNAVIIHSGTVIGSDGFGFANDKGKWIKIPQIGRVIIKDRVELGANCTIDRGAIEDTVINENIIIDNLVHIAHNCTIGSGSAIAGQSGIAGSTTVGKHVLIGGQCGFAGHLNIADGSQFNGMSMVTNSISEPGQSFSSGIPAMGVREWRRLVVRLRQLESMEKRLKQLEQSLAESDSNS